MKGESRAIARCVKIMRKDFGSKTYLYPQPVLIIASYDENGKVDVMNAAWGGICG